ncbi:PRC-barrel domain-containing protein [Kordiimonas sp.]|uniref:PRC-barrel domain-containing protein n=1 Tax=Kordiimonas sp. TaxID=1970157 RepID=UPI003A904905
MNSQAISATALTGKSVVGTCGEPLGTIEDIIINADAGQVTHVIVRTGGLMGSTLGAHHHALPFSALIPCTDGSRFRLDLSETELERLPEIIDGDYTSLSDPLSQRAVHYLLGMERSTP